MASASLYFIQVRDESSETPSNLPKGTQLKSSWVGFEPSNAAGAQAGGHGASLFGVGGRGGLLPMPGTDGDPTPSRWEARNESSHALPGPSLRSAWECAFWSRAGVGS